MESLLCTYRNESDRMVIVRCCGPGSFYLERVVFPFELLTFHCPPASEVTLLHPGPGGAERVERFAAEEFRMADPVHLQRPAWMPQRPPRAVGVRENASTICLDPR